MWAAGDGGTLLHFDGSKWVPVQSGTSAALRGIWGSGADNIVAVGDGTILRRRP